MFRADGDALLNYDFKLIDEAYNSKEKIVFEAAHADMVFMDKVDISLSRILQLKHFQHLRSPLSFVIRELIGNAQKSNLKRVYFRLNGLSITNPAEYERGMKEFTEVVRDDPSYIESRLSDLKMSIKVSFDEYAGKDFILSIENSAQITPGERDRILAKLRLYAENKNNMDIFDKTEGAGMGIFLCLKMLEKVGIKPSAIHIKVNKGFTISQLSFCYAEVSPPPYSPVANEILKELKELPRYPQNIKNLLTKLHDPDVSIQLISDELRKDPTLSAEILKVVNSAQYMIQRKIGSIKEALNMIGIKGLRNLLFSYGAMKTVSDRFGTVPEIWAHCYKTANIAAKISKRVLKLKNDDDYFTAGLLHDIGKIVLMGFDTITAQKIESICHAKGVDMPIMEEIMMGLSHAQIGGKIAQLWGFPESLVNAISYHHEPMMTTGDFELVNSVFLANYLAQISSKEEISVLSIEPEVRAFFKLKTNEQLFHLAELLEVFSTVQQN